MIKHYKKFLNQTVALKTYLSKTGSGVKTFDEPVDVNCYIAEDIKAITNVAGESTISTIQLYFDGDDVLLATLSPNDLFTVDKDYVIKRIQRLSDGHSTSSLLVVYV